MGVDNLFHGHVELPHVLDLAVHLVNFFGQMGKGDPAAMWWWPM